MKPAPRAGRLFQPVSNASLALYRVLFGLAACAVACAALWAEVAGWDFSISGHDALTAAVLGAVAVAGLCVALGAGYRASAAALAAGSLAAIVLVGDAVPGPLSAVGLIGAILFVVPAHQRWSVDVALRPARGGVSLPRWGVTLVQAQSAVVCAMAAAPLLPPPDALLAWGALFPTPPWSSLAIAGGGLTLGAVAAPAPVRRRLRAAGLLCLALLHLVAAAYAPTFFVAALLVASATLFLPPDWPTRAAGRPESGWVRAGRHSGGLTPMRCAGVALAALYFGLQLVAVAVPAEAAAPAPAAEIHAQR